MLDFRTFLTYIHIHIHQTIKLFQDRLLHFSCICVNLEILLYLVLMPGWVDMEKSS